MVVIVKENDNGKIELTKEELEKIIEQAKEEAKPIYTPLRKSLKK